MRLLSSIAALAVAACLAVVPVTAAVAAPADAPGADVSWPQCGDPVTTTLPLPTTHAFGVVGVNGPNDEHGNTTNSCLAAELTWASGSAGSAQQPTTSLYVMAQDPGKDASWWPNSNSTRSGTAVSDPYGTCTPGQETKACAYVYGYSIAELDTQRISAPAAPYFWWIDVEGGPSISDGPSWLPDTAVNSADIEGMVAGFAAAHARTGLYSTTIQWKGIAGTTAATSPLAGLPNWIAGLGDAGSAAANCYSTAFTPRSSVSVAQYQATFQGRIQDYDASCHRLTATPTPTVSGRVAVNQTLTVHTGTWSPAPVSLHVQWTRDGKAISGAIGSTYRTVVADAGHQVRAVVTGSKTGYTPRAMTSAAVKIAVPVSRLTQPHTLSAGQTLLAPNGRYHLTQQSDGNLVLYKDTGRAIWNTHTFGKGYRTTMQADGNLVVSTSTHHAVWASRTYGKHATYAAMQSDGNFVLYTSAGKPVWATRTNGK
ncbi:MAG TPA: hypothetical protein VIG76_06260 [Amnibacterium sp.]|uniref:hypothetical protein n=1 Tax=Amnibacterium sp. TaxID=1872496 RepID=UPI002F92C8C9